MVELELLLSFGLGGGSEGGGGGGERFLLLHGLATLAYLQDMVVKAGWLNRSSIISKQKTHLICSRSKLS